MKQIQIRIIKGGKPSEEMRKWLLNDLSKIKK